jgi:thiol:disulfide interchange protein
VMKESVGSLKAYFIVVSVLGIISSLATLGTSQINPLVLVFFLIELGFSLTYLYIGITLRKLLVKSPELLNNILFGSMAYHVIIFLLSLLNGFQIVLVIRLAIALLLFWYLLINVKRLSQEVKSNLAAPE